MTHTLELPSKINFASVQNIESRNGKPSVIAEGFQRTKPSDSETTISEEGDLSKPILSDTPNLYKQRSVSMSERFIKLIDSEKTQWLQEKHPWAFLLLTTIARRVRRTPGSPDGLEIGECHIGDYSSSGIPTRDIYRTALDVLIREKLIEKVETCRTRKKLKPRGPPPKNVENKFERDFCPTGTTTIGTKVKLLSSDIYDINFMNDPHRVPHRSPTEAPPKPHEQYSNNDKNDKNDHHHPYPSSNDSDELIDDFFKNNEIENPMDKKIHITSNVYLTQEELDDCIKFHKTREKVIWQIEQILASPKRKTTISNWCYAIKKWVFQNPIVDRSKENEAHGRNLEDLFDNPSNLWTIQHYHDQNKDQKGSLFVCKQGQNSKTIFIPYADSDYEKKVMEFISIKKIKKKGE